MIAIAGGGSARFIGTWCILLYMYSQTLEPVVRPPSPQGHHLEAPVMIPACRSLSDVRKIARKFVSSRAVSQIEVVGCEPLLAKHQRRIDQNLQLQADDSGRPMYVGSPTRCCALFVLPRRVCCSWGGRFYRETRSRLPLHHGNREVRLVCE